MFNSGSFRINSTRSILDFTAIGLFVLGLVLVGIFDEPLLFLAVLLIPFLGLLILNYRALYWMAIALIPLSTELYLSGGVMIDFPIELLMILLSAILFLIGLFRPSRFRAIVFLHPIALAVLAHFLWMVVATSATGFDLRSIKFLLAKSWYLGSFFFMSLWMFEKIDLSRFFNYLFYPMLFTAIIVVARHGILGFGFESVNEVLNPFYRNHVNYSAILAIVFPFAFYLINWKSQILKALVLGFVLIAIYFTYTRAAYIAVFLGMAYYFVVKFKLTKLCTIIAIVVAGWMIADMIKDGKYLHLAPDYEQTVSHKNFDDLIEATYKMQDVSTMERLHRWVAGFRMIGDRPFTGFGPGRFYENYQSYTVNSFQTYISDNKEQSGIHSYYLMTAVEQGLIGLALYLLLIFGTLWYGEKIYHRMEAGRDKNLLMACLSSLIVIHLFQLINDLLEADKVGPLFLINLALLIHLDIRSRKRRSTSNESLASTSK